MRLDYHKGDSHHLWEKKKKIKKLDGVKGRTDPKKEFTEKWK